MATTRRSRLDQALLWLEGLQQAEDACFMLEVGPGQALRVVATNPAFDLALDVPIGSLQGQLLEACLPPKMLAELEERFKLCAETGEAHEYDLQTNRRRSVAEASSLAHPGTPERINTRLAPIKDEQGQVTHLLGISRVVTDRRLEEAYKERWYKLTHQLPGIPFELHQEKDQPLRLSLVGPKLSSILGLSLQEVRQQLSCFFERVHPDDMLPLQQKALQASHQLVDLKTAFRYRHPDQATRWLQVHATPESTGEACWIWYGYLTDVTQHYDQQANLKYLATHDALTGLPNRSLFLETLEQALIAAAEDNTALALLFIDLDKFKPINDELGHKAGDRVLKEIAGRMRELLCAGDLLARLGGDEFVILMSSRPMDRVEVQALDLAEQVIQRISQPLFFRDGEQRCIGASIGISLYPQHAQDADSLIVMSDDAMYAAKHAGRGRACLASSAHQVKSKP